MNERTAKDEHPTAIKERPMTSAKITTDVHPLIDEAEIFEAKPNAMFSEEMRRLVAFLRFEKSVNCEHCARKSKHMWTMRCAFTISDLEDFVMVKSETVFIAGTPVCRKHCLFPEPSPIANNQLPSRCERKNP